MAVNGTELVTLQNSTTDNYFVLPVKTVELVRNVFYFGVIPLMIVTGFVLNVLCLKMFCMLKNKTSTVILLQALTITDILCLLNGIVVILNYSSRVFGIPFDANQRRQAIPIYSAFLQSIPVRIENSLTLTISLERLCSVLKPLKIRQYSTKKGAYIIVVSICMFVVITAIPNLFLYKADKVYSNSTSEYTIKLKLTSYGKQVQLTNAVYVGSGILFRYIPALGVAVSSVITASVVLMAARRRKSIRKLDITEQAYNKEKQVTKTLLIVTTVFFVCQLPIVVVNMIIVIDPNMGPTKYKSNVYDLLVPWLFSLTILNSAVNFFIYYASCTTYRIYLKRILATPFRNRDHRRDLSSSNPSFTNPTFVTE